MTYLPKVNDYVKWTDSLGKVTEGWVYFICNDYFTIEISVKDKSDDLVSIHKKVHTLVLCHRWYWDEVKYIKTRETLNCSEYKSQQYRDSDLYG